MRDHPTVRAHLRIPAVAVALAVALPLSACGLDQSLRSYDATKRPVAVAAEFEPLVREINAGLGGKADTSGGVEDETCGGDWRTVHNDPLNVEDSPYRLARSIDIEVEEPAEALRVMTEFRDHLSRAGWRVMEDTLKPFTRDEVSPTGTSGPPPGFSVKPPKGDATVAVGVERQETPLIVSAVVSSGCYRHPDEE